MKNLENREVCLHNKVRALFDENKVRFALAEQLCFSAVIVVVRLLVPGVSHVKKCD